MNPTVTIKSIKHRHILTDEEYKYIIENLGQPLKLASPWFYREGTLIHVTLYHGESVITLFDNNVIEGEFGNGIKFQLG